MCKMQSFLIDLSKFILFKKNGFFYLKNSYRSRGRNREGFCICWFIPQRAARAKRRIGESQEQAGMGQAEARRQGPLGFPNRYRGPGTCGIFCYFSRHIGREYHQKMEQLGFELASIWDVDVAGGSSTSYAIHEAAPVPPPSLFSKEMEVLSFENYGGKNW